MSTQTILQIRQTPARKKGQQQIRLTLRRPGQPDLEGEATIKFSLSDQEQEDLRWYMEGWGSVRGTDQDRVEIDFGNGTGMRLAGRCSRVKAVDPPANRVPLRLLVDLPNRHQPTVSPRPGGNGTGMRLAGRCSRVKRVDPPANLVPLRLPV